MLHVGILSCLPKLLSASGTSEAPPSGPDVSVPLHIYNICSVVALHSKQQWVCPFLNYLTVSLVGLVPPSVKNLSCSMTANRLLMSLLDARRFECRLCSLITPLKVSHLCVHVYSYSNILIINNHIPFCIVGHCWAKITHVFIQMEEQVNLWFHQEFRVVPLHRVDK